MRPPFGRRSLLYWKKDTCGIIITRKSKFQVQNDVLFRFYSKFMATNTTFSQEKYKELQKQLKNQLSSSPTAYTRGSSPSPSDVRAQLELDQISKQRGEARSKELSDKWFTDDREISERSEGALMRGLHGLATPLYGIVGGAEAALGKGSESGLKNVFANIKERETFGDLLRKYNVPEIASMPLGFALDVAFDPVNWLTVGTAAAIPRIAQGARKAGAAGLKSGLKSAALQKGATASKFLGKNTKLGKSIIKKSAGASEEYNKLIGKNIPKLLERNANMALSGLIKKPGVVIEDILNKSEKGKKFAKFMKYSPSNWFTTKGVIEKNRNLAIQTGEEIGTLGKPASQIKEELYTKLAQAHFSVTDFDEISDYMRKNGQEAFYKKFMQTQANEGAAAATDMVKLTHSADSVDMWTNMAGEAMNESKVRAVQDELVRISSDKTGLKLYDEFADWFKGINVGDKVKGEQIANAYKTYIGMFKNMKVPMSFASWVNAMVGNITMTGIAGLDVFDPKYIKEVRSSLRLLRGAPDGKELIRLMGDPELAKLFKEYPGLVQGVLGINPKYLGRAQEVVELAVKQYSGPVDSKAAKEIVSVYKKFSDDVIRTIERNMKSQGITLEAPVEQILKAGGKQAQMLTSSYASEVYNTSYASFINKIKRMSDGVDEAGKVIASPHSGAKALHWMLTKPMEGYDLIDRTAKLTTFKVASMVGLTEKELLQASKLIKISENEITRVASTGLYKLAPAKALELSGEIFMNYGAMPGAVKVLRGTPIFGAPFASFMYAMATKTGKTLVHNPAAFNKVSFAMQELSGQSSPLEKLALEQPYYEWYTRGGMMKLPFFQENPVYANLGNMLPYYTMNMLQPSERKYDSRLSSTIAGIFDKTPLFKTPEGQLLFDYFVQPYILRETNPRGMFDQLLWPTDATKTEKAGYMLRSAAETMTPASIGTVAGLPSGLLPDEAIKYLPSYRWRQIANATKGKTPQGIDAREPAAQRTFRSLLSSIGVPLYPLKTEYVSAEAKKNIKNN